MNSMLDVLNSVVKNVEMSEMTTINWLNWDKDIKLIIEFDTMIYFFVENSINSKIDRFVDVLFEISSKNDFSRFFLI
jgi:hypothetical protein